MGTMIALISENSAMCAIALVAIAALFVVMNDRDKKKQ